MGYIIIKRGILLHFYKPAKWPLIVLNVYLNDEKANSKFCVNFAPKLVLVQYIFLKS